MRTEQADAHMGCSDGDGDGDILEYDYWVTLFPLLCDLAMAMAMG